MSAPVFQKNPLAWFAWVSERILEIQAQLEKEDKSMDQVATDLEALRTALDQATNAIASRITALSGQITNSMTDAEVTQIKSEFQSEIDRLNALAADPNNPVPAPAP